MIRQLLIPILLCGSAWGQTTDAASLSFRHFGNGDSTFGTLDQYYRPTGRFCVSSDGRYVTFQSLATNLVSGDTNGKSDVFVTDTHTGSIERVSVGVGGVQGNNDSFVGSISWDGRFVAFSSDATNLVTGTGQTGRGIFVRDRLNGTTEFIFDASGDATISSDGRYVAFVSNAFASIYVYDRQTASYEDISYSTSGAHADSWCALPAFSADGRFVAFSSPATNLVTGDTNQIEDVFVRDRLNGTTERVSVTSSGAQVGGGNDLSYSPTISADGHLVVFVSDCANVVPGHPADVADVFVHDRNTGTTDLVSVWPGVPTCCNAGATISADGRYVAFINGDLTMNSSAYIRDLQTGTTQYVVTNMHGGFPNAVSAYTSISPDGRHVAFESLGSDIVPGDTNGAFDIFMRDFQTGGIRCLDMTNPATANSFSQESAISADGYTVVFKSNATNVIPSGDTNSTYDVFLLDRRVGAPELISVTTGGASGNGPSQVPSVSADGRYVTFDSEASNLVAGDTNGSRDIFLRDRHTGTTERVSIATGGAQGNQNSYGNSVSSDGRYVAFRSDASNLVTGDTNSQSDIFVRDRTNSTTERVNLANGGVQANGFSADPALSADGRYVAFGSYASNLVTGDTNAAYDIFVHDRTTNLTERVSTATSGAEGNADCSGKASISADGRFVAFASDASNLVAGDTNNSTDVFVHDRLNGTTERASVGTGGTQAISGGYSPTISGDGRYVAFESGSTNLVPGDTNAHIDVFLHDRWTGITERLSLSSSGAQANFDSESPSISADGRVIAFESDSTSLVTYDANGWRDVFTRDRGAGTVFVSFCFGDGSGTACPCGNNSAVGSRVGCLSSIGTGGSLVGAGNASISADSFVLLGSGMPSSSALYYQGTAQQNGGAGAVFGDGLRCAGGSILRLGTKVNSAGASQYPVAGDLSVSVRGADAAGNVRTYQCWYRNSAAFCSASTFNLTNGVQATWAP